MCLIFTNKSLPLELDFFYLKAFAKALETQDDKKTPPIKQAIVFLQADSIFGNSKNKNYVVNGKNHNIINHSKKLSDIYQSNHSTEMEVIKKENEFLRNEVKFLKYQLEITQKLLEKSLNRE